MYYNKKDEKLILIDFNPYGELTDALLFDWENIDKKTDLTIEFKIVKSESETINYTYDYNKCPMVMV